MTVGWFLTQDKGAVLYDAPERVVFRADRTRRMPNRPAAARR